MIIKDTRISRATAAKALLSGRTRRLPDDIEDFFKGIDNKNLPPYFLRRFQQYRLQSSRVWKRQDYLSLSEDLVALLAYDIIKDEELRRNIHLYRDKIKEDIRDPHLTYPTERRDPLIQEVINHLLDRFSE